MLLLWIIVFIVSLFVLVKGADFLIESSEKIGLSLGLSPFIVGVMIVGIGTSLPELISSIASVLQGVPEVVAANAVGSNIANILLVVGAAAVVGRNILFSKNLIDIDLPLLAISTVLFTSVLIDGTITKGEGLFLLITYLFYFLYTFFQRNGGEKEEKSIRPKVTKKDILFLFLGLGGLVFGAQYLIESLIELSLLLNIGVAVITITAVALGTSLPELLVSIKAALQGKAEVALGNIFGSNIFNGLVVLGVPALFTALPVDEKTLFIGVPLMAAATLLFVISGISKRIHLWEGTFFLLLYAFFTLKLFAVL
jgi:cation:H+ antiporter